MVHEFSQVTTFCQEWSRVLIVGRQMTLSSMLNCSTCWSAYHGLFARAVTVVEYIKLLNVTAESFKCSCVHAVPRVATVLENHVAPWQCSQYSLPQKGVLALLHAFLGTVKAKRMDLVKIMVFPRVIVFWVHHWLKNTAPKPHTRPKWSLMGRWCGLQTQNKIRFTLSDNASFYQSRGKMWCLPMALIRSLMDANPPGSSPVELLHHFFGEPRFNK